MKLLFENWRKYLLLEGMKNVDNIPDSTKVRIIQLPGLGGGSIYQIKLVNETHDEEKWGVEFPQWLSFGGDKHNKGRDYGPEGDINLIELKKCTGGSVFEIHSAADEGWGPFLYDVAIEFATIKGDGAMSARQDATKSSPEAMAVWDYYLANRSDVLNVQTDTLDDILTPSPDDNCQQPENIESDLRSGNLDSQGFKGSPLTKIYSKESTTIDALKAAGLLVGDA